MILSVSRRTDIPAFYSDWFVQRLKEGVVYVQNPFNRKTVYKIDISPEVVDCIVFWTKDPVPLMKNLKTIEELGYPHYYFLYTLNFYESLELNLPSLGNRLNTFKKLSSRIGAEKVIWRYDPIILSKKYTESYHIDNFHHIAENLSAYTKKCKISFLTHYKKVKNRLKNDAVEQVDSKTKEKLLSKLLEISKAFNINIELCSENTEVFNTLNGACVDKLTIENIIFEKLYLMRDKNQRNNCHCISSIDIGAYNTCNHQCIYCYANSGNIKKQTKYSIYSPLLAKEFNPSIQNLVERKVMSNIINKSSEPGLFS